MKSRAIGNLYIMSALVCISGTQTLTLSKVTKPFESAGKSIQKGTEKYVIDPAVGVTMGSKDAIEGIIGMVDNLKILIKDVTASISTINKQIDTLATLQSGHDAIDPLFNIILALTELSPRLEAILNEVARSIHGCERIVRPFDSKTANDIKDIVSSIQNVSSTMSTITGDIATIGEKLRVNAKNISAALRQAEQDIAATAARIR